ncbi:hypothetical protein EVB32_205 [Rhizobium phage RHph_TM39]|uniref:Uncharacterized protein n=2 Tax=Cuauhnahuacvirus TaxID=3044696 RepID=A0A7S5UXE4_9CAUD|nr:hypothetical protein PQC16_gp216 [Rhizobium phage RHph_TM30]YP_010671365.1 hypothetical protein PQC17_gp216 [Rhizobium phage RHph_Y65]QIG71686.1 hypothetical protein EVB94_215 [Rhizobium phage RHph_TM40]QIG72049.1 hypothetical protein EVB95_215 [Rhizobium phage RHph_TM2_3B]QIG72412.1 hypothetical protein EVB96_216 [Rhizobium phage RHph_TM3_3_6]QIG77193.1 hypothetical protein EVB32_205 [Rhizobium phage RHph_TM39]QIG77802.1 hypothetical protein EVB64_215 [Rhizobium phage RHph_TM61]
MYCNHFKNPITCLQCTPEERDQAVEVAKQLIRSRPVVSEIQESEVLDKIEPVVIVEEPESLTPQNETIPLNIVISPAPLPVDKNPVMSENTITVNLETVTGESIRFECSVCEDTQDLLSAISRNISAKNPSLKKMVIHNPRKNSV